MCARRKVVGSDCEHVSGSVGVRGLRLFAYRCVRASKVRVCAVVRVCLCGRAWVVKCMSTQACASVQGRSDKRAHAHQLGRSL